MHFLRKAPPILGPAHPPLRKAIRCCGPVLSDISLSDREGKGDGQGIWRSLVDKLDDIGIENEPLFTLNLPYESLLQGKLAL